MKTVAIILRRELASYFATPIAYVVLVIFLLMANLFAFSFGSLFERGQADLAPFFTFLPWLYLFLIPAVVDAPVGRGTPQRQHRAAAHAARHAVAGGARQILRRLAVRRHRARAHLPHLDHRQLPRQSRQRRDPRRLPRLVSSSRAAFSRSARSPRASPRTSSSRSCSGCWMCFLLLIVGYPGGHDGSQSWAPRGSSSGIASLSFYHALREHHQGRARPARRPVLRARQRCSSCSRAPWCSNAANRNRRSNDVQEIHLGTGRRSRSSACCSSASCCSRTLLLRGAQIDLTADKLYTVSEGTEHIVHGPQGAGEPLLVLLREDGRRRVPQMRTTACACASCSKSWSRAPTASSRCKVIDPQPFSEEEDRAAELGISVHSGRQRRRQTVPRPRGDEFHRRQGSHPVPRPRELEEQLEYDVAKLIHKLSSSEEADHRLAVVAADAGRFRHADRPAAASRGWSTASSSSSIPSRNLEPSLTTIDSDIDVLVLVHPEGVCRRRRCTPSTSSPCAAATCSRSSIRTGAAGPVGARPQQPDGAVRGGQVLASRSAARRVGHRIRVRPGRGATSSADSRLDARRRTAVAAHRHARPRRQAAWRRT